MASFFPKASSGGIVNRNHHPQSTAKISHQQTANNNTTSCCGLSWKCSPHHVDGTDILNQFCFHSSSSPKKVKIASIEPSNGPSVPQSFFSSKRTKESTTLPVPATVDAIGSVHTALPSPVHSFSTITSSSSKTLAAISSNEASCSMSSSTAAIMACEPSAMPGILPYDDMDWDGAFEEEEEEAANIHGNTPSVSSQSSSRKPPELNSLNGVHAKVFDDRLMDLSLKTVCNADCPNQRTCVSNVRYGAIITARTKFWGTRNSGPLSRIEHSTRLADIVRKRGTKTVQNSIIYKVFIFIYDYI